MLVALKYEGVGIAHLILGLFFMWNDRTYDPIEYLSLGIVGLICGLFFMWADGKFKKKKCTQQFTVLDGPNQNPALRQRKPQRNTSKAAYAKDAGMTLIEDGTRH
jgi:hypothetical protein